VILLDTNVISELVRPAPDPAVVGFLRQQVPDSVYTAAVCVAEIQYGREAADKPITVEDAMIAATVRAHGAVLATRHLADFEDTGIQAVNPWTP
jgi:toxin FitB